MLAELGDIMRKTFSKNPIILDAPTFGQDTPFLEDFDFEDNLLDELGSIPDLQILAYSKTLTPYQNIDFQRFLVTDSGKWAKYNDQNWAIMKQLGHKEFEKRYNTQKAAGNLPSNVVTAVTGKTPVFESAPGSGQTDPFWLTAIGKAILADPKEMEKYNRLGRQGYIDSIKEYKAAVEAKTVDLGVVARAAENELNQIPKEITDRIIPKLQEILKLLKLSKIQADATNEHRMIVKSDEFKRKVLTDLNRINRYLPMNHPFQRIGNAITRSLGL
jgi:hypothetical protein